MPVSVDKLLHVQIMVAPDQWLKCRRLDTTWLHVQGTRTQPAHEFALKLLKEHIVAPLPEELGEVDNWTDEQLLNVAIQWFNKQHWGTSQDDIEILTFEELKQAVYDEDAKFWKNLGNTANNWTRFPHTELVSLPPSPTAIYEARIQELSAEVRHLSAQLQQQQMWYATLPIRLRLFINDIDSFRKVREVDPAQVERFLHNGRLEGFSEDAIKQAFEDILAISGHTTDWGGEQNDLYTANVTINKANIATAFLLKGPAIKAKGLQITHCGHNGDQLVRLFESPANLFIVQFIGSISQSVIQDIEGKVKAKIIEGKLALFCIINGQETARILYAYGKLP